MAKFRLPRPERGQRVAFEILPGRWGAGQVLDATKEGPLVAGFAETWDHVPTTTDLDRASIATHGPSNRPLTVRPNVAGLPPWAQVVDVVEPRLEAPEHAPTNDWAYLGIGICRRWFHTNVCTDADRTRFAQGRVSACLTVSSTEDAKRRVDEAFVRVGIRLKGRTDSIDLSGLNALSVSLEMSPGQLGELHLPRHVHTVMFPSATPAQIVASASPMVTLLGQLRPCPSGLEGTRWLAADRMLSGGHLIHLDTWKELRLAFFSSLNAPLASFAAGASRVQALHLSGGNKVDWSLGGLAEDGFPELRAIGLERISNAKAIRDRFGATAEVMSVNKKRGFFRAALLTP